MNKLVWNFLLILSVTSVVWASNSEVILPLKALPQELIVEKISQVDEDFVAEQISESIYKLGSKFELNPILVETTDIAKDAKKFTLKVRRVKFSDGSMLVTEDLKHTIERCARKADDLLALSLKNIVGYSDFIDNKSKHLSGVRILSKDRIEIEARLPSPLLLENLAFINCAVVKPSKNGSYDLFSGALATGPYKFGSLDGSQIELVKNEFNPNLKPFSPDKVIYRPTDRYGNFETLSNWATVVVTEAAARPDERFNVYDNSQLGSYLLAFNSSKPPFDKKDIREAISKAINFDLLNRRMKWMPETMQEGVFPLGMQGFKKRDVSSNTQSVAKKMLLDMGFTNKKPFKFHIIFSKSSNGQNEVRTWQEMFTGLPIQVTVEELVRVELVKRRKSGDYQAIRIIKLPGSPDANRVLASFLSHSLYNVSRSNLPTCDRLIKSSLFVANRDERYSFYKKSENCLLNAFISVPLASIQPGAIYILKPWSLKRSNRYYMRPYLVNEWEIDHGQ